MGAHNLSARKAVDNGGLRYGALGARSARRYPPPPNRSKKGDAKSPTDLTVYVHVNHHRFDPRGRASRGRHQIGNAAGFKSEQVADFLSESVAGFIGIRSLLHDRWTMTC